MHNSHYQFFEKLGVAQFEVDILSELFRCGVQPASVIAKQLDSERTKTYRHLEKLVSLGYIRATEKQGIRNYFVRDIADIERIAETKIRELEFLKTNKSSVIEGLKSISEVSASIPQVTIYDRTEGVGNILEDILSEIALKGLLSIRMLATNTYFERSRSRRSEDFMHDFLKTLKHGKVHLDLLLANGQSLVERIESVSPKAVYDLPADQSSLHLLLVGQTLYLIVFDDVPKGVKIENPALANVMHLFFDISQAK